MRVLICGDKEWKDIQKILQRIMKLPPHSIIIHGSARGADIIAGEVARELHLRVQSCPADWSRYGRAAGPIRNRQMLDLEPHLVIGFHSDIGKSKGTADMLKIARAAGIETELIE